MAKESETPRSFAWNDPFDLDGQLAEDEKLVRESARAFAQGSSSPARARTISKSVSIAGS
jgi:glutaryl-CoA dehydrogenase